MRPTRYLLASLVWLVAAVLWADALAPGSPLLQPLRQSVAGALHR